MKPKIEESEAMSKEEKALFEFKRRVGDLLRPKHDDQYLATWLKARCYDLDKSEKMFRESMAYRDKMRVDTLLEEYTPPQDVKNRLYGMTVIFDMENVSTKQMWRPGLQMYLHLVKVMEDNYPEMMKRMFVIKAPRIFPLLWKIGRPLISEDMKKKIHVLGSDYQDVLLKYIDKKNLPKYLGGLMCDPDGNPKCNTMICHGGVVPRTFYLSELESADDMESVTVNKGQRLKVDFTVEKPGSLLRWEFRSDDYDIGFGVVYISDGKEQEIVPVKRTNAHQLGQDGSMTCDEAGMYAAVFDNRYSWSRGKTIHYLLELHTSDVVTDTELDTISTGGSWTRLVRGMQITHL